MGSGPNYIAPWTGAEIDAVLRAYGFGAAEETIRLPDEWDPGRARARVRTATGDWFLKKHGTANVRREAHDVVAAFRWRGGWAPKVVRLPDYGTWLDLPDESIAEAQHFVPGENPTIASDAMAVEAIEQVAILHILPTDLVPPGLRGWYDPVADGKALGEKAIALARETGFPADDLADLVAEDAAGLPAIGSETLVHGDLWRGNWLVDGGKFAALTDFDYVHRGPRLDDLCDVILAFCTDRDTEVDEPPIIAPPAFFARDRAAMMLAEYERTRGRLSDGERAALPAFVRSQWFRHRSAVFLGSPEGVHLDAALRRLLMAREIAREAATALRDG